MIRNSIIVWFFAFSLCIMAGCEHDPKDNPEPDHLVVLNFSTESLSGSLLKSAANTAEDLIEKIILFGVNDQNQVVQTFPALVNPPMSGKTLTVPRMVKSLYAIANPSAAMEAVIPSSVSDIMEMVGDFTNAPRSPFLMSGKSDVNGKNVNIQLVRTVAKIDITGKNGFQITAVTVANTPDKEYAFKRETLSVPTTAGRVSYSAINSTSPTVYVAENSRQNPTQLVVTGQFQGKQASYTIVLKTGGQNIDIVRNTCYQVGITPITESECTFNITIPEWMDVITDDRVIPSNPYKNGIKILAIGNSYSFNAMQYMFDLLKQLGVNESKIILVNAYIGGASLHDHTVNAKSNSLSYTRQTFQQNGVMISNSGFSLQQLIKQETWDVITLQQASLNSGDPASYSDLDYLINYVKDHATNPAYKLGWHMTWAYADSYINGNNYEGTQRDMYNAICSTVQTKILPNNAFSFIIPTGTAIQNARVHFGDNLNFDGTHLTHLGSYIAAATWIKTITGFDIAKLKVPYTASASPTEYGPPYIINESDFSKIVPSVNAAAASPFTSP